jgi:hypothetical protein
MELIYLLELQELLAVLVVAVALMLAEVLQHLVRAMLEVVAVKVELTNLVAAVDLVLWANQELLVER